MRGALWSRFRRVKGTKSEASRFPRTMETKAMKTTTHISTRMGRHQDATVYHDGDAFGVSMARVGDSIANATFSTLSQAYDCQDAFMPLLRSV